MVTLLTPQNKFPLQFSLRETHLGKGGVGEGEGGGGGAIPLGDVGGSMPLGQTLQIIHGAPLLNGIAHLDQFQLTYTLAMLCEIKAKPGHVHLLLC